MKGNMENDASTNTPQRGSFARLLPPIARVVLGLILLLFGLNGFLQFIPQPKDMPQDIVAVMGALMKAGYLQVVSGTMVLVGVLLLINRFVPLALAFLAPLVVGILTFHFAMSRSTIAPAIVVLVLELYLAWAYRDAFRSMLRARVSHGIK